jgi:hypothetical protein
MSPYKPFGPNLAGVVADANAVGLKYVVIGGFSVIANGYLRIVACKRLADRPRDRNDLAELEALHGELPREPVPGLDE